MKRGPILPLPHIHGETVKDCLEMFGINSRRILGNVGKMGYESSDGVPKPKKKMSYVPRKLSGTIDLDLPMPCRKEDK